MKARIFKIMQFEKHRDTGETLITREQIAEGLDHKTIVEWAWIYHDKDVYTEKDEEDDPKHVAGTKKPPHYHVVISLPKNATELDTIAKWFGVPSQYVEVGRGRGAFADCVEYLTHEAEQQQQLGKTLYSDEEVHANFDFRRMLDERALSRAKYGEYSDRKTFLRQAVLHGDLTLQQVEERYTGNYIADMQMLERLRLRYIQQLTPPKIRHNYYICGSGGVGKGVASELLAHVLFPEIQNDNDLFFRVGADGVGFEGYDGQPVIIWDDCRSSDLLHRLGGRGNVFTVFDTFPKRSVQNVKFGSVSLVNKVNIVNSVQPWADFLNGLVGEYKDKYGVEHLAEMAEKSQSYRRFPYIVPLRAEDFDILINRAYQTGDGDYGEYIKIEHIRGNFGRLIKGVPDKQKCIVSACRAFKPLIEARDGTEARDTVKEMDADELSDFGTVAPPDDDPLPF